MVRTSPHRALGAALVALAASLAVATADVADQQNPVWQALAALPAVDLDQPQQQVLLRGVARAEAEALFSDAVAALYVEGSGELRLLMPIPAGAPGALLLPPEAPRDGDKLGREVVAAAATLRAFSAAVADEVAALAAGGHAFLVKVPGALTAPARLPTPPAEAPPAGALAVALSEGFENNPWARWQRQDTSSGAYTWSTTTCDKRSGAVSADAVRGGTAGAPLACDALYPSSIQTWMVDGQCEAIAGAGQAWLEGFLSIGAEEGYDYLFVGYERSGGSFVGSSFWGSLPGWWRGVFNLRQWYGIGDLTQRACNQLALVFDSDSTIATGFGARVDDITITTDAPSFLTCGASAAPASGKAPLQVAFTPTVGGATAAAQHYWAFDDGFDSSATAPTHRYVTPGEYYPTLFVSDGDTQCQAATRVDVAGSGVTPSAGTFAGTTDQGKPISFTVAADGTVTGYALGYACSSTSGDVTVSGLTCATANGSFDCGAVDCQTSVLKARVQGTFDSPTSALGVLSFGIRPTPGGSCCYQFDIPWSAALGAGSCSLACTATVPATGQTAAPVALHSTATPSGCAGSPTFDWDFGDGSPHSSQQSPSHAYAQVGAYTWNLAVTTDGQVCTKTGSITISTPPPCSVTCSATAPGSAVVGTPAQFQSNATPLNCAGPPTYDWSFGDGSPHATAQNPSHTYAQAGTFSWTLTVTADGQTCTRSGSVTVAATSSCSLTCTASTMLSTSVGESVRFWGSASLSSCLGAAIYDWNFGDGSPHSTEATPSHTYSTSGSFTWTMTVTADGKTCTKTGTMQVCGVECSATVPAASRIGAVVTFAGAATATSCLSTNWFEWDYGDGSTHGMSATMEHAYAATGTYTWTLEVSNFTTTCTRTGTITIGEAVACADCGATVPATTEVGVPTAFRTVLTPTDCSATLTYRWTFGDGSTSTAANPNHTYCAVGPYSWTLTVTINGVACTRSGTITVGAPTALDCSVSVGLTGACPYEAVFAGQTSGCNSQSTYAWTFGDGGTATGRTPKHMYTSQGSYDWTMTTTLAGATCTRTGTVSVTAPTAIAAVGTPSTTSGAPPLALSFTGGLAYPGCVSGATYAWAFGDGGTSSLQSPPHTYAAPGFYTWALTATADGLTHTAKGPIVVSAQAPTYTWAPQVSGTIDTIVDGTFLSQSAGWTAATRGLRRTIDGGRTWTLSRDTVAQAVRFSSATAGFYAYSCGIGRTSNGGGDWTIYPYDSCPSWSFTDIFPTSATFAWATTTQGRLWYFSLPPGSAFSYGWRTTASGNLRSLWFSDAENGWAVGSGGKIIRLMGASGTATDAEQVSGTTVRLNGVRMLDGANGWIVGDGGTILHTTDGGAAWNPVASGTTIDLLAVDFRDATNGWIVGRGGLILATTDGGTSWTPEIDELTADLRTVSAPAGTAVYAAGVDGTLRQAPAAGLPDDLDLARVAARCRWSGRRTRCRSPCPEAAAPTPSASRRARCSPVCSSHPTGCSRERPRRPARSTSPSVRSTPSSAAATAPTPWRPPARAPSPAAPWCRRPRRSAGMCRSPRPRQAAPAPSPTPGALATALPALRLGTRSTATPRPARTAGA